MKIIFFGSSDFAVPSLERLLDSSHEVLAALTQPDRKKGRHLRVSVTPIKKLAVSRGIAVYQPESVSLQASLKYLKSLSPDLFVVVAFGQILPASVLSIPKLYSINLHASLLPKYRGAAPVSRAVMKGEKKTGLSIIRMNERMDAGDIILQRSVEIEKEDTSKTLKSRLSSLGAILLLDALRFIKEDKVTFKKQNEKKATPAPRLKKEDGLIDWNKSAKEIHNKVRGTIPWPGAYTYFDNKKINIWKTTVVGGKAVSGEVAETREELIVGTGEGLLKIDEVQIEAKSRMTATDFLRGFRGMKKGDTFRACEKEII